MKLLHPCLVLLLCLCTFRLFAQDTLHFTVYFDVDKSGLSSAEKVRIQEFVGSLDGRTVTGIRLTGHTDADAGNAYNQNLSKARVNTVMSFLQSTPWSSTIESRWMGEESPLNNNASDDEKRLNRRVEMAVFCQSADETESEGYIKDLYNLLEQKKQVFCIKPSGDTVLRLEQGTIIYIPADPFGEIDAPCIEIRAKEFYKKSDMILENLSTTSNGQLLESAGMVYLEAMLNRESLNLAPGKKVLVMMPADSLRDDMQAFFGERDPHTDLMNWTADEEENFGVLRIPPGEGCDRLGDLPVDNCERCRFLPCRTKRIDEGLKGVFIKGQHQANKAFRKCQRALRRSRRVTNVITPLTDQMALACAELDSLFEKYGVTNRRELMEAMNKEAMDKYGVKTLAQLQDTLRKIKLNEIENKLLSGKIDQRDLQYYLYNTSRLGWINTDAFSKLAGNRITMNTDMPVGPQYDCKAVFTGVRGILPSNAAGNHFQFYYVPKANEIWLIGMRFENHQASLSMKRTKTSESVEMAPFREVTLEELKEALRGVD